MPTVFVVLGVLVVLATILHDRLGSQPDRTGAATMWGTHAAELSTARFSNKIMQRHG